MVRTYVVVFAPKLKKNWRSAKQTMNGTVDNVSNLPARMATEHIVSIGSLEDMKSAYGTAQS